MKKLLLLFTASLICLMSFADETIFSYTLPAIGSTAITDYQASMEGNITAGGGTIKFGSSTKFEARSEASNGVGYKLDGDPSSTNSKYVLLTLSAPLAAGDVISLQGFSTSSTGYVFKLSNTRDAANSVLTTTNCVKTMTTSAYTVAADDCLNGQTTVYITRNSSSLYFYSVEITRQGSTDPDGPETPVELSEIKIEGALNYAAYYAGETLNMAGLLVNAYYNDGSKTNVTSQAELTADATVLSATGDVNFSAAFDGKTVSKAINVYVCNPASSDATELLSYAHSEATPAGITISGTTVMAAAKIHNNADEVSCIQFKNGYISNGTFNNNAVALSVEGGFKAGDEIAISAFFNNSDNTKEAKVSIFTLNEDNTPHSLHTMGQAINGRNAGEPFECVYTLEADADNLYLGRTGGTALNIYTIKVLRPEAAPEDPTTPFEEVWNAIETNEELEVEFYGYVSAMDGNTDDPQNGTINWDVVENPLEATPSGAMKRIMAEDALKVIRVFDPAVLNTPGNEPGIGDRVLVTGTTWANGINDGTIKGVDEKGWATSVENAGATSAEKAQKLFIDGQIVIVKDGVRYNAIGLKL